MIRFFSLRSAFGLPNSNGEEAKPNVIRGAGSASRNEQSFDGFLGRAGQATGGTHGATLDQTVWDLRSFFG
jgi:hypothetical protein